MNGKWYFHQVQDGFWGLPDQQGKPIVIVSFNANSFTRMDAVLLNERFKDQNLRLSDFYGLILVVCPVCGKRAEVRTDLTQYATSMHCPSCCHHAQTDNRHADLRLKVRCEQCDHQIEQIRTDVTTKVQRVRVRCRKCGHQQLNEPTYREYIAFGMQKPGFDPFLGLSLWLQHPYREELFWALNYEHLAYLQAYIAAKLRERNDRRYMTMVEILPSFIKSRKNRTSLLRLIEQLRKK